MTPPHDQTQSGSGPPTPGGRGEPSRGAVAGARPTLFRVLLTERHLQTPKAFRAQFARAAQELAVRESDPEFRRLDVSGRQFQRWLDGLTPRPYSCRVLEHMLGRPVSELMRQTNPAGPSGPQPAAKPGGTVAGAAGSFGAALRLWREARGLSLRRLAARSHYSKSLISDVENGRRPVRLDAAKRLDECLDAEGKLSAVAEREHAERLEPAIALAGSASPYPDPRVSAGHRHEVGPDVGSHCYANLAAQLFTGREGWAEMQRRTLVFGAGSVAALGVAAPVLALETARHGLTLALAQQGADVAADEWQEIVAGHGYNYQIAAPAGLVGALVVDVLGLQYAIAQCEKGRAGDTNLRELRRAGALLAALMAMTVANLGHVRHAERWWRSARRIAQQSGDIETVAWVCGREVVRAIYEDRPLGMILRLADDAEAHTRGAPPKALPQLVGGKAQALALAGDSKGATTALRQLRSIHDDLPSQPTAERGTIFGWGDENVHFTESFVYSHLGDVDRATKAQDQALATYPARYRRGPVQIELQRALCLVRGRDLAGGVCHAQTVITGLSATEHIRPIFDLGRRVLEAIPTAQRSRKDVSELHEALIALDANA